MVRKIVVNLAEQKKNNFCLLSQRYIFTRIIHSFTRKWGKETIKQR